MNAVLSHPGLLVAVVLKLNNHQSIIPSINFKLPYDTSVTLVLMNKDKKEVKTIIGGKLYSAGVYTEIINIEGFPAGEYYYKFETEKDVIIKSLSLIQ